MATPQIRAEQEALVDDLMPSARQLVEADEDFVPLAAYLGENGSILHAEPSAGIGTERELGKQVDLVTMLQALLRGQLQAGARAVALATEVEVVPVDGGQPSEAIRVHVEHVGGVPVDVYLPYTRDGVSVHYGEPFASPGELEITPVA
jgi:hypothetical protein